MPQQWLAAAEVPDAAWGEAPDLERAVVVLTPRQAKGLEFDVVLLADPDVVLPQSLLPNGIPVAALLRYTERPAQGVTR